MNTTTSTSAGTVARTSIEIPGAQPAYSGKVRDLYDLGDRLLIVASPTISRRSLASCKIRLSGKAFKARSIVF